MERQVLYCGNELAYVPIPKNASTTMNDFFADHLGLKNKHSLQYEKCLRSDWLSFTIVRHPLDRLYSCYLQKTKLETEHSTNYSKFILRFPELFNCSFIEFVNYVADHFEQMQEDSHIRPQVLFTEGVSMFFKLENLEPMRVFLKSMGFKDCTMHSNASRYDLDTKKRDCEPVTDLVRVLYSQDYEAFNYLW